MRGIVTFEVILENRTKTIRKKPLPCRLVIAFLASPKDQRLKSWENKKAHDVVAKIRENNDSILDIEIKREHEGTAVWSATDSEDGGEPIRFYRCYYQKAFDNYFITILFTIIVTHSILDAPQTGLLIDMIKREIQAVHVESLLILDHENKNSASK